MSEPLQLQPMLEEPDLGVDASAAYLLEDVSAISAKSAALQAFMRQLTSNLSFQDFMRELLLTLMKAIKCEAGSLFEINYREQNIFFRAAVGHASDQVVRFVIPMGRGIVGHVAESRQTLVVQNIEENRDHLRAIANAIGFDTRNLIAVPLIIRGKVFGVVELINRIGEENFKESDVELLNVLCEYASRAIEIRLMIAWASQQGQMKSQDVA